MSSSLLIFSPDFFLRDGRRLHTGKGRRRGEGGGAGGGTPRLVSLVSWILLLQQASPSASRGTPHGFLARLENNYQDTIQISGHDTNISTRYKVRTRYKHRFKYCLHQLRKKYFILLVQITLKWVQKLFSSSVLYLTWALHCIYNYVPKDIYLRHKGKYVFVNIVIKITKDWF